MAVAQTPITPDTTIPDLVRRLRQDSVHLIGDEIRLAKLEMQEAAQHAAHGGVLLAFAFAGAVGTIAAATVLITVLLGMALNGHMWFGALIAGGIDLAAGGLFVFKGLEQLRESPRPVRELAAEVQPIVSRAK